MNALPKLEQAGNLRIITFTGERLGGDVENILASELDGQTAGLGEGHLLLDFTHVESISSVELGTLINLHKRMKTAGGRLTLFNLSPHVLEVFAITRLEQVFTICREDVGTAID